MFTEGVSSPTYEAYTCMLTLVVGESMYTVNLTV